MLIYLIPQQLKPGQSSNYLLYFPTQRMTRLSFHFGMPLMPVNTITLKLNVHNLRFHLCSLNYQKEKAERD